LQAVVRGSNTKWGYFTVRVEENQRRSAEPSAETSA
jgi:hypothetical protein